MVYTRLIGAPHRRARETPPPFPNTTAEGHCQTEHAGAALQLAQHDAVRDRDVDREREPVRRHVQRRQLARLPRGAGCHRQRAAAGERGVREARRRLEACEWPRVVQSP